MKKMRIQLLSIVSILFMISCVETPQALEYHGFTSTAENETIAAALGETILLKSNLICENGLKEIEGKFYGWNTDSSPVTELIPITGSPKTYEFSYALDIPSYVSISQTRMEFYMRDYSGKEIMQTFTIEISADSQKPSLTVLSPHENQVFSPNSPLVIEVSASDDIAMKQLKIESDALGINKALYPAEDIRDINGREEFDISSREGTYEIVISAEDLSGNVEAQKYNVVIMEGTKPELAVTGSNSGYVVQGGRYELSLRASTNSECTLEYISVISYDLGVNLEFTPGATSFTQTCSIEIPGNIGTRMNIPIQISARNNYGEISNLTVYVNTIEKLYIVGSAVMCSGKEGKAMQMEQDVTDKNIFTINTWVDAPHSWFKFLSEPKWDGSLNLGLSSEEGKIVNSGNSGYIWAENAGYHAISLDMSTWEYSVTPLESVPAVGKYNNIYLYGENFSYKENGSWVASTSWETMVPMKQHPDTPHRFYLDVYCNKAVLGFAAQDNKNDGGTFFGIEGDAGWKWVWWEHISDLIIKDKEADTAKLKEDSRQNTVMRVIIDTYLGAISWLEATEYTYPTPEEK